MVRFPRSLSSLSSLCRHLLSTSTVRLGSFGCHCSSVTVFFLYLTFFFIYSVSSVCPFLRLLFASGFKIWKEVVFFLCHISYAVPRCFDLLFTHCSFFKAWVWGFFAQSSPSHFHSREAQFLSFNTIIYILVPAASWGPEHEDQEAPGTQDLKS